MNKFLHQATWVLLAMLIAGCSKPEAPTPSVQTGPTGLIPHTQGTPIDLGSGSEIHDLATDSHRHIFACGVLGPETALTASITPQTLLRGDYTTGLRGFVMKLGPHLEKIEWFSLFPAETFEPTRLVAVQDGSVCLGGKKLGALADLDPQKQDWEKSDGVLIRLNSDGANIIWMKPAGPNQDAITGLSLDVGNQRLYFTAGSKVRGAANYIIRKNIADGESVDWRDTGWCVYLHHNQPALQAKGQFLAFYEKAKTDPHGFDYDGESGWGPVKFSLKGFRLGGQVICLPDGDVVVSSCLQYDFREKGKKSLPGFDLFLARYGPEGALRWSTNLYQDGDSVHTPDQKPVDLAYDLKTDRIYVLAKQHGSNLYRFKGKLAGDTGNMMISWLGQVEAKTGKLLDGWYFQNNRSGKYGPNGIPASPPHPKLAGNQLNRVRIGPQGLIHLSGAAGAKMWTTENARNAWPENQESGRQAALLVLDPDMKTVHYASCYFPDQAMVPLTGLLATTEKIILGGAILDKMSPIRPKP